MKPLTKPHFELIAGAVHACAPVEPPTVSEYMRGFTAAHDVTSRRLADALATTNPKFDRAKFLAQCGVSS